MLDRPMTVVNLFLVISGSDGAILDNEMLDKRQILFMVKPGIITDANACHNAASINTSIDFLCFVFSSR